MPVNNLASPRHNWENPRDIYETLVDDALDFIVLDNLEQIIVSPITRPHNGFTPITDSV